MTSVVRNLQKTVNFNLQKMKGDVKAIRRILRVERFDVSVVCVEERELQEMNRRYRGKNEPTDVLSFPAHENLKPGRLPDPWSDLADLGDMFLGMGYIQKDSQAINADIDDVLPVIIAHGFCHLLGYDHETQEQWKLMHDRELHILEEFRKLTGQELQPLTGRSEFTHAD